MFFLAIILFFFAYDINSGNNISSLKAKNFSHLELKEYYKNDCTLAILPEDIKNEIARYLIFDCKEDDIEFSKRALKLSTKYCCISCILPDNKSYLIENENYSIEFHAPLYHLGQIKPTVTIINKSTKKETVIFETLHIELEQPFYLIAASCNFDYIIIIKKLTWRSLAHDTSFVLINTKKTSTVNIHFENYPISSKLLYSAISSDGLIGALLLQENNIQNLEIINFKTKVSNKIEVKNCKWIGFNKQNTKLATVDTNNNITLYLITSAQDHAEKSKKTLKDYFYKHAICKPVQLQNRYKSLIL